VKHQKRTDKLERIENEKRETLSDSSTYKTSTSKSMATVSHTRSDSLGSSSGSSANSTPKNDTQLLHAQKNHRSNYLINLSPNILFSIFKYIDRSSIVIASQTCKAWQILLESSPIWLDYSTNKYMNLDSILIKEYEREKIHFQSIKDGVIQETDKTFSLIKQITMVRKLKKRSLVLDKLNTLIEHHVSLNNFAEAGLCILMQADEYTWENQLAPTSRGKSTTMSTSVNPKRATYVDESKKETKAEKKDLEKKLEKERMYPKENLYHIAIGYFDKSKYWELGIGLLEQLRKKKQNFINDNLTNLEMERSFYQNIRKQDRFFENYFFVEFWGKGFEQERYQNEAKYIFRGTEAEPLGKFVSRIKLSFPNVEVVLQEPSEQDKQLNKQYIRIRNVKPSSLEETKGKTKKNATCCNAFTNEKISYEYKCRCV